MTTFLTHNLPNTSEPRALCVCESPAQAIHRLAAARRKGGIVSAGCCCCLSVWRDDDGLLSCMLARGQRIVEAIQVGTQDAAERWIVVKWHLLGRLNYLDVGWN